MYEFEAISKEVIELVNNWEPVLQRLSEEKYSSGRNSQNRTIKMIVGHIIDSASNNTHRVVRVNLCVLCG